MTTSQATDSHSARALDLSLLPTTPLYGAESEGWGWQLSPTPFLLSPEQAERLHRLGGWLQSFMRAIDTLYKQSQNPNLPVPGWVADLYDQGKPDALLQMARNKRFKSDLPLVLRPDLLLNDSPAGWTLCEIDAVPGGLGFTSALNRFYRENGFSVVELEVGMPTAFLNMLKAVVQAKHPEKTQPVIAIVLSDEANDYRAEMQWLVDSLRSGADGQPPYANIELVHPKDVDLVRDELIYTDPVSGESQVIDLVYRFFELFDLPNISKIELIQYAVKRGFVQCTPPFKPHVEEKLSLALLHHPVLQEFWQKELGAEVFAGLKEMVPPGWVVDPAPLPPQAVIANLAPGGKVIQDFRQLKVLTQKERELVLKPSGFSPLGWGSRGVTIGHDHAADVWAERLDAALDSFGQTPYILQQFIPAGVQSVERLDLQTGEVRAFKARTRLCPYYFVTGDTVELVGVLATSCPQDKKLIHGMKDAVLAPVMVG